MTNLTSKREPTIRRVAVEKGMDPELILALLALERDFPTLHGYGARGRLRRAAEALIDASLATALDVDDA